MLANVEVKADSSPFESVVAENRRRVELLIANGKLGDTGIIVMEYVSSLCIPAFRRDIGRSGNILDDLVVLGLECPGSGIGEQIDAPRGEVKVICC